MALWTNPPRPFVGDVERDLSGDIRRWVGDGGNCSSNNDFVRGGSNFGASASVTGDSDPVASDTVDTLEYRLLTLPSPTVEAVFGGDGGLSSAISSPSGSRVDSRLMPGSLLLVAKPCRSSNSSSPFRAEELSPRSGDWRNQDKSFDEKDWVD